MENNSEKAGNLLLGFIEVGFVIATIGAMTSGEGFHVRQGWRGISNTSGQLYECGHFPRILRTNPQISNCTLPGFPNLIQVSSLEGYYGAARMSSKLWEPLGLRMQYYMFVLCVLVLPMTLVVLCAKFGWEQTWKLVTMLTCALFMALVASFQKYLMVCPGYREATLQKFENHIQKLKLTATEYDKVVICYVEGFFMSGLFASVAGIAYTLDVIIYLKRMIDPEESESKDEDEEPRKILETSRFAALAKEQKSEDSSSPKSITAKVGFMGVGDDRDNDGSGDGGGGDGGKQKGGKDNNGGKKVGYKGGGRKKRKTQADN